MTDEIGERTIFFKLDRRRGPPVQALLRSGITALATGLTPAGFRRLFRRLFDGCCSTAAVRRLFDGC
jgi:hypothetical protein